MRIKPLAAALAAVLLFPVLSVAAYASDAGSEANKDETTVSAVTEQTNAFTPSGTGTVVDNATNEDGKEFYTIITENENIFYLVIDKQRNSENVYFLNAVTEADLLALAVPSEDTGNSGGESAIPDNTEQPNQTAEPTPEPEPSSEPEPEKSSNAGTMILVAVVVLAAGGAAYYLKIYRPKQLADMDEDEYDGETDATSDWEDDYELPDWDEDVKEDEE